MAINAQGEPGRIRLFYDFYGEDSIAGTAALRPLGPFSVGGQGSEDIDAGVPTIAGVLSGAGRITTTNEVDHTTMVGTQAAFDVALSGTLVLETRVQMENLDTKEVFIGFSDIAPGTLSIQTDILHGCYCNDYEHRLRTSLVSCLSAELTDAADWHAVYNGGTASAVTASTSLDLDAGAVAGEWQVLRLEIAPNGDTRWYVDGDLKKTVAGAASTSVNIGLCVGVEAKGAAIETLDVDYILVKANRDWNA
jgi:hypothetical protein